MRIPIPDDCCGAARELIAQGLSPDELLEFMRGDVVCLRGTARAFASRVLKDAPSGRPMHVRYDPAEAERLMALRRRSRSPIE